MCGLFESDFISLQLINERCIYLRHVVAFFPPQSSCSKKCLEIFDKALCIPLFARSQRWECSEADGHRHLTLEVEKPISDQNGQNHSAEPLP